MTVLLNVKETHLYYVNCNIFYNVVLMLYFNIFCELYVYEYRKKARFVVMYVYFKFNNPKIQKIMLV